MIENVIQPFMIGGKNMRDLELKKKAVEVRRGLMVQGIREGRCLPQMYLHTFIMRK